MGMFDNLFKFDAIKLEEAPEIEKTSDVVELTEANNDAEAQSDGSEDTQAFIESMQEAFRQRDEAINNLTKQVNQLIKYGAMKDTEAPGEAETVTDAPTDYVPLRELDFSNDGKF